MKKIAILGATGHIAKSLIYNFKKSDKYNLYLFARSNEKLDNFLKSLDFLNNIKKINLNNFNKEKYDVIINCVGIGDPGKLANIGSEIFQITEYYDNFILDYLKNNNDCLYINFSSGAAYGRNFSSPVSNLRCFKIDINKICDKDYYGIIKLYSEAKHRSYENLNIVDLRIFAFFSRFIDLNSKYFISELVSCIKDGKEFKTGSNDIVRDFTHPKDLFNLVKLCIKRRMINDAFDVYSSKPTTKFEILNYFAKNYDLKYNVEPCIFVESVTGNKYNYYSINKKVETIGYTPEYSSMDCIIDEAKEIL